MPDKKLEDNIAHFCSVTGASTRDARKFLEAHKRLDVAIDAYYNNPNAFSNPPRRKGEAGVSVSKLEQLFDHYKDPEGQDITVDGTIQLCTDLDVDPEDVVLLAVAYELKSPRMGIWKRQGWIDGWRSIGVDNIESMKGSLDTLRTRLGTEGEYFKKVYNYTFDFARSEGQRSLALETAQALWALLLNQGAEGGALVQSESGGDVAMDSRWRSEYNQWWFDFLKKKGGKGISKDTWTMFLDFIRSTDSKFSNYDSEAAWPSTIDDFVEYAKERSANDV